MKINSFFKKKSPELKRPPVWKSWFLLVFSIVLCGSAIVLYIMTPSQDEMLQSMPEIQAVDNKTQTTRKNYRDVVTIEKIGNFERQVKPIKFDDIVLEKRSQDFEFKDAEYVQARKAAWTVEVMDVSKEEVIRDYLAAHEKRKQFAYFRYIAPDKTKRYVLTFDDFNSEESALKAIEENEFNLPKSIVPEVISFKKFVGKVDQYHLQRNVRDYKRSSIRAVVLRKTAKPVYQVSESSAPVRKKYTNRSHVKRSSNKQQNAFKRQDKATPRFIKPNNNKPLTGTNDVLVTQPASPAEKPAVEKKPAQNNDALSDLINTIE